MIGGILVMGGLGVVVGVGLALASKIFYVYVDPKIEAIEDALPGANCGGCGLPGCSANAVAIVAGKTTVSSCVAGGPELADELAAIMGVEVEYREPEIARPGCTYGIHDAPHIRFRYQGVADCRAAALLNGGSKVCPIGCLGLGTCMRACPFDAISMGPDDLPVVDKAKCTGCGTCEAICPKHIITLTSNTLRTLHLHVLDECLAPCQQRCPAQVDIPLYLRLAKDGRYKEALEVIKERVPMPLSIGRVCPQFCATECRRNDVDEPVNINFVKRFCADVELHSGQRYETPLTPSSGKRVAIVGGGPAGLAAAYYLKRLGHDSTIFEAMPKLGGMLRYGIPEYRLPKKILDWEIEGITGLGVDVRLNQKLGPDFSLTSLKEEGFDAVFLGMGAWGSRNLGTEGEDLDGVLSGTRYLIQRGLEQDIKIGKRVVIIGGGNTAIDAARTSWRLGAEEVTVLYRRSRKEMPAADYEVVEAENEGVKFHFLAASTRLIGKNGRLTAIEFLRMELGEPDESGRRRPVPVEGTEEIIEVDNVIAAIGQFPLLDLEALKYEDQEIELTRWNTVATHEETMQTNIDWVFAAGDVVNGAATVVEALGTGRKAAMSLHKYFKGETRVAPAEDLRTKMWDEATEEELGILPQIPQNKMPDIHVPDRAGNFKEVELGFTEDQNRDESNRCLQCGIYCYRRN